jgi:hypothetical protein
VITRDDIIECIERTADRQIDTRSALASAIIAVATLLADEMAILERRLENAMSPVVAIKVPDTVERGNRIHQEVADSIKGNHGRQSRPVMMMHDEVTYDAIHPEWRCANMSCPTRPPTRAATAPKCYTCDRPMMKCDSIGETIDRVRQKVATSMAMPAALLKAEPALSPTWDVSKWIEARREWRPTPGKMAEPRGAALSVSACQTATGDQLDYIAKLQGLKRCVRYPRETDVELRARIEARRVAAMMYGHEKVSAALGMYPSVTKVQLMLRDKPGQVRIECEVRELTDALQRRLGMILDDVLPIGVDWQLECVPQKIA